MTTIGENAALAIDDPHWDEPPAENVIEALRRVMRDLPAIGKDQKASAEQGGYAYRGIEQITRAAQSLFARHGVLLVPSGIVSWERDVVLVGRDKREWHDDRVLVAYRAYGPGGVDDYIDVGPIPAIGRDGADKGANKCMTQAFKYALMQLLCISDRADDNDGTSVEAEGYRDVDPGERQMTREQLAEIRDHIAALREQGVDVDDQVMTVDEDGSTSILGVEVLRAGESGLVRVATVAQAEALCAALADLFVATPQPSVSVPCQNCGATVDGKTVFLKSVEGPPGVGRVLACSECADGLAASFAEETADA